MAYGSATTRARTPATGTRTASSAMQQTGGNDNPTCAHKEPMLRLECKNGNNRGRMFYKCARDGDKCRSFFWEDSMNKSAAAGTSTSNTGSTANQINARSASVFNGGGGNVLGAGNNGTPSRPPAGRSFTPASQTGPGAAAAPPGSGASSSSATQYTQSPSSPQKRGRAELSDDDEDTIESSSHGQTGWGGFRSRAAPSTSPQAKQAVKSRPSTSQTVEEAIEEDWDDEIDDFDEFEAGESPSKGKGKFVSFGASAPSTPKSPSNSRLAPTTPPSAGGLAPGLPVTPKSAQSASTDKRWNEILSDPSSPFHARANALLNGSGAGGGHTSPATGSTASLLPSSSTESAGAPVPRTPQQGPSAAPTEPQTPSEKLGVLSALAERFSTTLQAELASASKVLQTTERQLKAARQKASFHEKREKDTREEIVALKEKLRFLEAENAQLKAMHGE